MAGGGKGGKGAAPPQTVTTKNEVDPWIRENEREDRKRMEGIARQQYQPFSGQRFQGMGQDYATGQDMTRNAAQGAMGAVGSAQDMYGQLMGGSAPSYGDMDRSQYMDPYQQQVIDQTMGRMQDNRSTAMNNDRAGAIGQNAFGGDRASIMEAQTGAQHERNMGEMANKMNQQGFMDSSNRMQQDMQMMMRNRQQQGAAAQGLLGSVNQMFMPGRQMQGMADRDRMLGQQQLDYNYGQHQERQNYAGNQQRMLDNQRQGFGPGNTSSTQSQDMYNNPAGSFLGGAMSGAGTGLSIGGPLGAGIGGLAGGLLSFL